MKIDSSSFVADPELMNALDAFATPMECSKGTVLFTQGEPPEGLYILQAGAVELAMTAPNGREIFRVTVSAGAVLGLPALIGNQPYSLTATATENARVTFVPREKFYRLMAENPALSLSILRVLAAEVRTARFAITEA
ncbi:MAG TPA: cyclic nucleotide-binding domain-containing protein [Terracidiphilus sp.]|nr:cyclic nucleotide-binding domain-containing protein [Terracidiphilus sp.]